MHRDWLRVAIKICGSRAELARLIGAREETITYWLNHGQHITLEYAIKIEKATNGAVNRLHLVSHLERHLKLQIKAEVEAAKNLRAPLTIQEKVTLGLAVEEVIGSRQGVRNDHLLREKIPEVGVNSEDIVSFYGNFKGRTVEIAARQAGFGNYKTYQQAKKIVQQGIPELVNLVDKEISISLAARIADYPAAKQRFFLSFNRRDMTQQLNKEKETKSHSSSESKAIVSAKNSCRCCDQCKALTAWAMLSTVGLFKNQTIRRKNHEQDQDCEAGAVSPRTTV